jgi:hypothetical protein
MKKDIRIIFSTLGKEVVDYHLVYTSNCFKNTNILELENQFLFMKKILKL